MGVFFKKSTLIALASVFAFMVFLGTTNDAAAKPKVKEIKEVSSTTVILPMRDRKHEDDKVVIRVNVKNLKTGKVEVREMNARLGDGRGKKKVTVDGLNPNTPYAFTVQVKKRDASKSFGSPSEERTATTLP